MEFFVFVGIWALIMSLAPFGIWALKARVGDLERKLHKLELELQSSKSIQQTDSIRMPPVSAVTLTPPVAKPAITPATAFVESITTRKDIVSPAPAKPEEPLPSLIDYLASPVTGRETPPPVPAAIAEPIAQEARSYATRTTESRMYEPSEPAFPAWLTGAFSGGRLFVTLGILLLFMGSAMLFKYAAQFVTIPLEARFIGVGIGAAAMILFGSRQMGKRRDWGLYMQGGGLGLLFLTVFTAFRFYHLLPGGVALAMLVLIGGATFALSILNDAMALSVLAVIGGFLAPIITATGGGSHIALFSYYLLINLVIFAIAWKKSWRVLNTIGFVFTFAIGLLWGGQYYVPHYYASVQMFLLAYFLLYSGIGLLYAARSEVRFTDPIDFASIWGVPLVGCLLQFKLVEHIPHGNAISSALLGLFYAGLYLTIERSANAGLKKLREPYMWLSALFFTLAIPFAFSEHTTAMLWAMEGTALIAMMNKTGQRFYGYAGGIVLFASNLFMFPVFKLQGLGTPFMNPFYISAVVMAVTHIASAYMLGRNKNLADLKEFSGLLSLAGMGWWFGAGLAEVATLPQLGHIVIMPCLAFASASAFAFYILSRHLNVPLLGKPIGLTLIGIIGCSAVQLLGSDFAYHPLEHYGYIGLPLAFAAHYFWLSREKNLPAFNHVVGFITLVVLAGFELGFQFMTPYSPEIFRLAGLMLAAAAGVFVLTLKPQAKLPLLAVVQTEHKTATATPLIYGLFGLTVYSFTQAVVGEAGRYIALINIVEMAELASLVALLAFALRTDKNDSNRDRVFAFADIVGFGFINALMLRSIASHFGITYFSDQLWQLPEAMTALTILWTLMAMGAMIVSSRKHIRAGWALGAGLLGVVVVKLFVIDLANIGTLSRIISFMGVGMLSLLLGYIAPMPVKKKEG